MEDPTKRTAKIIAAIVLTGTLALAGGVAFTGPILEAVAPWAAKAAGVRFSASDIAGNLISGLNVKDLAVTAPAFRARVAAASVKPDWKRLFRGRLAVASVRIESPDVTLLAHPAEKKNNASTGNHSAPAVDVESFQLENGVLRWGENDSTNEINNIRARLNLNNGHLRIDSAEATFMRTIISAAGVIDLSPLGGDVSINSSGVVVSQSRIQGSPKRWNIYAQGKSQKAAFVVKGNLANLNKYDGSATFHDLDLSSFVRTPPWIGPLSGEVDLSGSGLHWPDIDGRLRGSIQPRQGPTIKVAADMKEGKAHADVSLNGAGVSGKAQGTFAAADKFVRMDAHISTDRERMLAWTKDVGVRLNAQVSGDGAWPKVHWKGRGEFADAIYQDESVGSGNFHAKVTGPVPLFVDGAIEAKDIHFRGRTMSRLRLAAAGDAERHGIFFDGASGDFSIALHGNGGLADGAWRMRWDQLQWNDGGVWRSTAPFATVVGRNAFEIADMAVRGQKGARLLLTARYRDKYFETLKFDVEGLDSQNWKKAGFWPFAAQGVFSARGNIRGKFPRLTGTARFDLRRLAWNDVGLGRVQGGVALEKNILRLDNARWESPGGTATLRGSMPSAFGRGMPDFNLSIESEGINLDFLNPLLPSANIEGGRVDSHLHLACASSVLSSSGTLRIQASRVRILGGKKPLQDVALTLKSRGREIQIAEGKAKAGKKGSVNVSGLLRVSGPDIALTARKALLDFDQPDLTGRLDADLTLTGAWSRPSVNGAVKILEARYTAGKKKKEKKKDDKKITEKLLEPFKKENQPAPEPESPPGPLAMDITVNFPRNVWYRQEDSAVEAKGDLRIRKSPHEATRMFGTVETVRGDYFLYGRAFEVQAGSMLTFAGETPPDPVLDVTALYTAPQSGTRVTVTLTGTARNPRVALTSEPPLSDQDILSVLLFGAPSDRVGGGGSVDGQAAAAQALSDYLTSELRGSETFRALGLDVFRVQNVSSGGEVTAGRYLTKNLFVSYGQSLGDLGQRELRAEYTLTPHWSMAGTSADGGRYILDLLFKFALR